MPPEKLVGLDSSFRSYQALCVDLWQHAAVLGSVSLEGLALFWALQPPRADSLAALARTIDRHLRSPAFLRLMKHSLALASSGPHFVSFPSSLLRKESDR